jgi:hypothetical protein
MNFHEVSFGSNNLGGFGPDLYVSPGNPAAHELLYTNVGVDVWKRDDVDPGFAALSFDTAENLLVGFYEKFITREDISVSSFYQKACDNPVVTAFFRCQQFDLRLTNTTEYIPDPANMPTANPDVCPDSACAEAFTPWNQQGVHTEGRVEDRTDWQCETVTIQSAGGGVSRILFEFLESGTNVPHQMKTQLTLHFLDWDRRPDQKGSDEGIWIPGPCQEDRSAAEGCMISYRTSSSQVSADPVTGAEVETPAGATEFPLTAFEYQDVQSPDETGEPVSMQTEFCGGPERRDGSERDRESFESCLYQLVNMYETEIRTRSDLRPPGDQTREPPFWAGSYTRFRPSKPGFGWDTPCHFDDLQQLRQMNHPNGKTTDEVAASLESIVPTAGSDIFLSADYPYSEYIQYANLEDRILEKFASSRNPKFGFPYNRIQPDDLASNDFWDWACSDQNAQESNYQARRQICDAALNERKRVEMRRSLSVTYAAQISSFPIWFETTDYKGKFDAGSVQDQEYHLTDYGIPASPDDDEFVGFWPSDLSGHQSSMGTYGRQSRNVRLGVLQDEAQQLFADASCPTAS